MNKEFWKDKRVLITGNNGFKGCWLTKWLDMLGAKILGISLPPEDESIYCKIKFSNRYEYKEIDVRDYNHLEGAVNRFQPEIVFHLAAQAIVKTAKIKPYETFDTNMMGTLNLLEILRSKKYVKAIVIITSDKVYKNMETNTPYVEDCPLGGNEPYSASKACQEIIAETYRNSYFLEENIGVATARAANVFGGGDNHFDRLIPYLIKCSLENILPTLRNPNAVRPWQYVLDLLNGYLILAENLYSKPLEYSKAWNFGPDSHIFYTVSQISDIIWKCNNKSDSVFPTKVECGFKESQLLMIDSRKSNKILMWNALYDIQKGFDKTVDFYRRYFFNEGVDELMREQIIEFEKQEVIHNG